jgi:ATP synthase protein I
MTDKPKNVNSRDPSALSREIGIKAALKLRAQRNPKPGVWQGLGMMGLIGWSVSIPTLLGVALGIWLDKKVPGQRSWTLTFLVAGLVIGCFNAWQWVSKEDKAIRDEQDNEHE